jgi:histone acetyltransferase (RNA polymerase elongator complex component)
MAERPIIIPIFVPHKGCPHDCIFCNQKKISGQLEEMTAEKVPQIIEAHLATIRPGSAVEVAFYGGSFTAIDKTAQESFLKAASPYLADGRVSEIRLSTRPDHIEDEILDLLKKYGVKTIELGVQSLDESVLNASSRGHDASCVRKAAALIREKGFRLGIQTMTGLPGDSREKCLETAKEVVSLSPEMVRIYPVLVIKGTELERLYNEGLYRPQTLDEAVGLCAELLEIYESNGINVIRIGLQPTESIRSGPESEVAAGPMHPAFRQLVESRRILLKLETEIAAQGLVGTKELIIRTGSSNISNVTGQKRSNVEYLKQRFGIRLIRVLSEDSLGNKFTLNKG